MIVKSLRHTKNVKMVKILLEFFIHLFYFMMVCNGCVCVWVIILFIDIRV